MIVASTCRQGVVESPASFTLCPSAGPAVILLVVQGSFSEVHWTCLGCLQQGRLPRVSSQCLLDCLWQSDLWAPQMRKMDWECSLAIWQSPSGAKQSLGWKMLLQWESCRVFFFGRGQRWRRHLQILLPDSIPPRLAGNSLGGIGWDDLWMKLSQLNTRWHIYLRVSRVCVRAFYTADTPLCLCDDSSCS